MDMKQLKMVERPISTLKGYDRNPRKNDAVVARMVESIKEFGFRIPVVAKSDGSVVDGHLRLKAAQRMGMKSVPVVLADELTDAQVKAFRLLANRSANWADWDDDLLRQELADLKGMDFDLSLTGFDAEEISSMLDIPLDVGGLTDPDEVPEPPVVPVTKPGDVWLLGKHRLMCGDSTSIDAVDQLMRGEKADMVWTDPPYNVNYEGGTGMKIQNDSMPGASFRQFLVDAFVAAYAVTKAGRPIYVAHADSEGENFRGAVRESGFLLKQCLVWVKNSMVMGRQDYQWQHEPILYGWKPGEAHKWYGDFNKKTVIDDDVDVKKLDKKDLVALVNKLRNSKGTTVIREDKPYRNDIHPTMKPVALVGGMILNSSRPEDVVLDLFGGGGATLIACEKHNRNARLMELDPKYCDVIVKRWEDFTGKKAVLETSSAGYSAGHN
jgi:DNA modification methylase